MATKNQRHWEIDLARCVAIVMVVISHLARDLSALAAWEIDVHSGFWHNFQRLTVSTFITAQSNFFQSLRAVCGEAIPSCQA